jgi:hypothetical protein
MMLEVRVQRALHDKNENCIMHRSHDRQRGVVDAIVTIAVGIEPVGANLLAEK